MNWKAWALFALSVVAIVVIGSSQAQQVNYYPAGSPNTVNLTDCMLVRTSSTVITIGPFSSSATPCAVFFGTQRYVITSPGTATISAGTSTVNFYVDSNGTLTVGYSGPTITCGGSATCAPAVTTFPVTSNPIGTWTSTSGTWDVNGGTLYRGWLRRELINCTGGLSMAQTASLTTCSLVLPTTLTGNGTQAFGLANPTASTSGTQQNSPSLTLAGTLWDGSASQTSTFTLHVVNVNATPFFKVDYTGTNANNPQWLFPSNTTVSSPNGTYIGSMYQVGNNAELAAPGGNGIIQVQDPNTPANKTVVYGGTGQPGAGSCGTGVTNSNTGSTDWYGSVTEGSGATGCTITWSGTHTNAPFCNVTAIGGNATALSVTSSGFTITNSTPVTVTWSCGGRQ